MLWVTIRLTCGYGHKGKLWSSGGPRQLSVGEAQLGEEGIQ